MPLRTNPNAEVQKLLDAAKHARLPFDRDAWLNLSFFLNEQYVEWNADSNSIRKIPRTTKTRDTPRPIINKITHFVQQQRAMLLKARPTADVLPATDDMMDMSDAQVARAYCEWAADPTVTAFDRQLSRAVMWALVTPSGYLKWIWNPRTKQPEIVPCSFFEIFPDPYAKSFDKCRYVIHSQFLDVEQVYEAWGIEVKASKVEKADEMRTQLMRGMGSSPVLSGVTVNELWSRPSRRDPHGKYTVWTGNDVLVPEQPLPYKHERLPFTQLGMMERPDSLHYMSPVSYLRSAQMELNQFHAQRIQIRKAFANPKWWIPAELQLESDPDDSPSQVLRGQSGNGMLRPELMQPTTFPGPDDGAMIEQQMMNIVGLHEVSQAQVPGRVEAAKAIELLKEGDDDRLATMTDLIKLSVAEGFYQILRLAQQFEKDTKILQIYTREGLPEVRHFEASKIKPGMRVVPQMGTGLASSRAARQDQLMSMWQNKIITDPALMAELMEMPFPSFEAPKAYDMRLARNENLDMAKDIAIAPNSWDDHFIHMREHNDYRKTQDFLKLADDAKQKFEFHVTKHEELMIAEMSKQAKMAQLAQAATGQPPPGGQAPQPAPDGGSAPA